MADTLEQIVQRMVDAGESEENIASVIKGYTPEHAGLPDYEPNMYSGFLSGAKEGAKGFVKGLLPGVGEGVKGILTLPISILKEVISTAQGVGNFTDDPMGTLHGIYENLKNVPGEARDAVKAALDLAARDPQAFGKEVGKLTGNVETGIASARAVPLLPKPLASKVGAAAETFGKKASWPLRITGAHQIIGGNVLGGIATMSTPELMEKGGGALKQWGENVKVPTRLAKAGSVLNTGKKASTGAIRMTPEQLAFSDDVASNLDQSLKKVGSPAQDGLKAVDEAIAAEKQHAQGVRIASGKREASLQAEAAKQAAEDAAAHEIELAKEDLVKGKPRIVETVKAPGQSMTTTYKQAEDPTKGLTAMEQELLKRSTSSKPALAGTADKLAPKVAAPMTSAQPIRAQFLKSTEPQAPVTAPAGPPPRALMPSEEQGIQALDAVLGDRPPMGNGQGAPLSADELAKARQRLGGPKPEAPLNVPASRSNRGDSAMSGISTNDMEALKQIIADNPGITAEQAAQELVLQRGQRQTMYRSGASLDRMEQSALDREPE